jgi:hypothetical protein
VTREEARKGKTDCLPGSQGLLVVPRVGATLLKAAEETSSPEAKKRSRV